MSEDRKDKRTREGVLLCETPSFSKFLDLPYRILFSNSSETKRKPLHRSGKHDTRLGSAGRRDNCHKRHKQGLCKISYGEHFLV